MTVQHALPITELTPTYRVRVLQALGCLRRDWEEFSEGESLVDLKVSIGLVLADIADCLELTQQERFVLLGKSLSEDIESFMKQRVRLADQ